jgi:2-aminoethylphosphonate-pyruvate transaminase
MQRCYGERAAKILERLERPCITMDKGDSTAPSAEEVALLLDAEPSITHVWFVHCETTSGIVNPAREIAGQAKQRGKIVMLDAMSSFGALPLDMTAEGIDVMVSSSNKCLEGVPGFSYVLCRTELLEASRGQSHSVALDLFEQWRSLESNGQFRFTPPTHALAAFHQALKEHEKSGGVAARHARYARNAQTLIQGMRKLGFTTLLGEENSGPIIQTFHSPRDPNFDFNVFYEKLRARGFAIYPGKLTQRPTFRIGTIGHVDADVMNAAVNAIGEVIGEMNVTDLSPAA